MPARENLFVEFPSLLISATLRTDNSLVGRAAKDVYTFDQGAEGIFAAHQRYLCVSQITFDSTFPGALALIKIRNGI